MKDIRGDFKIYHKRDIAMQYFNAALKEYVEGSNMFVVLHLAGAAEEMFGRLVSINNVDTSLQRAQRWMKNWYSVSGKNTPNNSELNKHILNVKNGIKHIDGANDLEIEFDIHREAKEIIRRAIENFNQLPELKQSAELLAYYKNEKT